MNTLEALHHNATTTIIKPGEPNTGDIHCAFGLAAAYVFCINTDREFWRDLNLHEGVFSDFLEAAGVGKYGAHSEFDEAMAICDIAAAAAFWDKEGEEPRGVYLRRIRREGRKTFGGALRFVEDYWPAIAMIAMLLLGQKTISHEHLRPAVLEFIDSRSSRSPFHDIGADEIVEAA